MQILKLFNSGLLVSLILGSGCSSSPTPVADSAEARKSNAERRDSMALDNQAAEAVGANYFVELEFPRGSGELHELSKGRIDALLNQAKRTGKLDDVIVLSWGDREYPSKQVSRLSKTERELASERNKAIEEYIKTNQNVSVEAHNMAERPNALKKLLNTKDERLKQSLVAAGLPTTESHPKYPSKASHAVILVTLKK